MVARAHKRKWIDLVAGLVVGAAAQPLALLAGPVIGLASLPASTLGGEPVLAQLGGGGASRARMALNAAIEAERLGDLDKAAGLFREAQTRAKDLTADEQRELDRRLAANALALQARREAREQIARAELSFQQGRPEDVAALVKKIKANELYLSPADKQRFQLLCRRMHMQPGTPPAGSGDAAALTHDKVRQARAALARGDFDAAEALAREADQLHAPLAPQEDSPRKILDDLDKARRDPKNLLLASRTALQQGQLDRAEQLARSAEKQSSPFTFMLGDSPSKILKEIQAARRQAPASGQQSAQGAETTSQTGETLALRSAGASPALPAANAEKARALVRQGREALASGDVVQARKCAEQASTLRADLHWSEDNPARLLEDIARSTSKAQPAAGTAASAGASLKSKEEALALLKQGREQLAKGELEEANKTAARLRAARHIHWGLFFEDTPDKLQADVIHARSQRDKELSVQLLTEARRRFEKKDYEGAKKLACEAQSKHGPYSIWDLGDRPNKLLAEVETAHQKERLVKLPDPPKTPRDAADLSHGPLAATGNNAVAQNTPGNANGLPRPTERRDASSPVIPASFNTPESSRLVEARQLLKAARQALNNGDLIQARQLADRVRDMHVVFNAPNEESPASIYRDIDRLAQNSPNQPLMTQVAKKTSSTSPYLPSTQGGEPNVKGAGDNGTGQKRARQLVAEARELLRKNQLLEARNKIEEARRFGGTFRPDEESPSQVYQQIAFLARQRIDSLVHHASEMLRYGTQAPMTRCQEAERDLSQARQLAAAFGQDMQPIDLTMRMVEQLRKSGGSALVNTQPEPEHMLPPSSIDKQALAKSNMPERTQGASQTKSLQSMQLLEKARLELRSGEMANARHLAEEAVKLGAGEAGLAVIRSIDAEEAAQSRRKANRGFDEVLQAYQHRDYRRANLILASIDTNLLDERRRGRLREILNTPEMRPGMSGGGIALTAAQGPSDKSMDGQGDSQPVTRQPSSGDTGHSRVTDDPGQSMLARTAAMREIKFQQLRTEGLSVQSQALERFRTGQTEVALDMLHDYLLRIAEEQLDPGQLSLLRRPIDSRLQQLQLLNAQASLANNRFDDHSLAVKKDLARAKSAEQVKQKNIQQLMKQFNELLKEAKYPEAEMVALKVKELDPDNAMATAAVAMARLQRNHNEYMSRRDRKEEMFVEAMDDTDDIGDPGVLTKGMIFSRDKKHLDTVRRRKTLEGFPTPRKTTAERNIERRLTVPVSLSFANTPLRQVIEDIRGDQGINIFVDEPALAEKGISLESPVTMHLDNISLKSGLKLLLDLVHLRYVISDDVLKITTEEQARGNLQQKVYQVTDLVIAVENFGQVGTPPDPQLGIQSVNQMMTTPTTPMTTMTGMQGGQPVGMPAGSSMANPATGGFASDPRSSDGQWKKNKTQTHEDMLIKLITNTIAPRSWAEQGGPGTIDFHPLTMALVISQTPDIQDQVQDLLNALRRLIDQEVAVEVKFISIAEDFFERIGVNFNMNIVNNSRQAINYQPQLVTGQFAQPGFINSFNPGRLLSGLTPAGTLTNDLNIPISTSTYSQAIPPFGGYPGIPGYGGLTLGLAFLSDIQVFLFMEAVQGDVRSNVMQAPKLTLFNGQTATISITDFQFFTLGVSVQNGGFGQLVYNPLTTLFPLGITLTIQAVISGDRRFVRLSLTPSLANVVNGEVLLFPVVTPIFPLFDGTATGQPVVFTQFVQQPHITRVSVQTTVAVPDGGTVLMGGLKRLSEGRNEYGPPVISKIPYLSRLFRNIGYGRSAESLLIMVTPRIIIQAEEEEKQTGYVPPAAVAP